MRKKDDALKGRLLDCAREIMKKSGIEAINIRDLARQTKIATGTVYGYFSNKDEILFALTEEYWKAILDEIKKTSYSDCFCKSLKEIFLFLKKEIEDSAGKLMNNLGKMEKPGQARMLSTQSGLVRIIIERMNKDSKIKIEVWNENFTKQKLAEFIVLNMITSLRTKASDIDFLIEIIHRTVY